METAAEMGREIDRSVNKTKKGLKKCTGNMNIVLIAQRIFSKFGCFVFCENMKFLLRSQDQTVMYTGC